VSASRGRAPVRAGVSPSRGALDVLQSRVGPAPRCSARSSLELARSRRLHTPRAFRLGERHQEARNRPTSFVMPRAEGASPSCVPRGRSPTLAGAQRCPSTSERLLAAACLRQRPAPAQDAFHQRDPRLFTEAAPARSRLIVRTRLHRTFVAHGFELAPPRHGVGVRPPALSRPRRDRSRFDERERHVSPTSTNRSLHEHPSDRRILERVLACFSAPLSRACPRWTGVHR
jgi:hypothetical protein